MVETHICSAPSSCSFFLTEEKESELSVSCGSDSNREADQKQTFWGEDGMKADRLLGLTFTLMSKTYLILRKNSLGSTSDLRRIL